MHPWIHGCIFYIKHITGAASDQFLPVLPAQQKTARSVFLSVPLILLFCVADIQCQ